MLTRKFLLPIVTACVLLSTRPLDAFCVSYCTSRATSCSTPCATSCATPCSAPCACPTRVSTTCISTTPCVSPCRATPCRTTVTCSYTPTPCIVPAPCRVTTCYTRPALFGPATSCYSYRCPSWDDDDDYVYVEPCTNRYSSCDDYYTPRKSYTRRYVREYRDYDDDCDCDDYCSYVEDCCD